MAHWEHRDEPRWKDFRFNQPYARGLARLKNEVLAKTDFDPATLWQWGTMQAMALVKVLEAVEAQFGSAGQRAAGDAIAAIGLDVGRQILAGVELPADMTDAEFFSFYATVINRIAYASLEAPKMDAGDKVSFDILWCPHQDHYKAFDCRIQRYFVRGMIDAAREHAHPRRRQDLPLHHVEGVGCGSRRVEPLLEAARRKGNRAVPYRYRTFSEIVNRTDAAVQPFAKLGS